MRGILMMILLAAMMLVGCGSDKSSEQKQPESPPQAQTQAANFYTSGQYKVGADITAGEYVAVGTGYVEVTSDGKNILANDNITNARSCIPVVDGEYVKVTGDVKLYAFADAPKIDTSGTLPSGQYKAGRDIKAGEYKIALEQQGYYEVTRDARYNYVQNQFTNEGGQFYARVDDGQYLKIRNGSGQFVGEVATPAPAPASAKVLDLGMTLEQFKASYKANALSATGREFSIDNAELMTGEVQNVFKCAISPNVVVMGSIDKASGRVKESWVLLTPKEANDMLDALIAYGLIISVASPELTVDQRGELMLELKLEPERIKELQTSDGRAVRGNVKYHTSFAPKVGFMFAASAKDL